MTGVWFSGAGLSGSLGRMVDPGLDPDPPAVLTLIAEPLPAGALASAAPVDGPGFWIGVLVCVERYTISLPLTATPSDPFLSSRVSISTHQLRIAPPRNFFTHPARRAQGRSHRTPSH